MNLKKLVAIAGFIGLVYVAPALLGASTTQAGSLSTCLAIGDFARRVAEERDDGVPEAKVRDYIIAKTPPNSQHGEDTKAFAIMLAERIYSSEDLSPTRVAAEAEQGCLIRLRGKKSPAHRSKQNGSN